MPSVAYLFFVISDCLEAPAALARFVGNTLERTNTDFEISGGFFRRRITEESLDRQKRLPKSEKCEKTF